MDSKTARYGKMDEEPAEAAEEFQYELLEVLKKMNTTLEKINANLESFHKKEKKI